MDFIGAFIDGLKELPHKLFLFACKIFTYALIYGVISGIVMLFVIGIMFLIHLLGVPEAICRTAGKTVAIVGQIIPAACCIGSMKETEDKDSADICFFFWILISVWIWNL